MKNYPLVVLLCLFVFFGGWVAGWGSGHDRSNESSVLTGSKDPEAQRDAQGHLIVRTFVLRPEGVQIKCTLVLYDNGRWSGYCDNGQRVIDGVLQGYEEVE